MSFHGLLKIVRQFYQRQAIIPCHNYLLFLPSGPYFIDKKSVRQNSQLLLRMFLLTYSVAHYMMYIYSKKGGECVNKIDIINGFVSELRRGTIILCVLANLKEQTYGYGLIERLAKTGISIEANTLYPLLRRLEGQELLKSTWNTEGAKPRKYYELTAFGQEVLEDLKYQWGYTVDNMKKILEER